MRKELTVKGSTLAGVSDLTLFARIREGFVPSLEAVTYKTRLQMLLRTLGAARHSSQEYSLLRPFSDAVERVGAIHSVRVVILEAENQVMLAATFDGAWETYLRTLWLKVGTLLDAIFCNTEDYAISVDSSFEQWASWARRVQVETPFFYGTPALTVPDVQYLRQTEAIARDASVVIGKSCSELAVRRVEDLAREQIRSETASDKAEVLRQSLQALSVLYRLAEVYVPGTPDGDILLRASRDLLLELTELPAAAVQGSIPEALRLRFARQLAWFMRDLPERRAGPVDDQVALADVQGGILKDHPQVTHGCLLLIGFDQARAAHRLLDKLIQERWVSRASEPVQPGAVAVNLAFTHEGLRALGLDEATLQVFPQEFREGMAARAGVLGDLHTNHPRRWNLPPRHGDKSHLGVELSCVHLVLQLRVSSTDPAGAWDVDALQRPDHPFHAQVQALSDLAADGVRLLSVQPMWRNLDPALGVVREHFGFADGLSNPVPPDPGTKAPPWKGAQADGSYSDLVPHGDILLGYADGQDPATHHPLLRNGSFLVVRKLAQDVAALETALQAARDKLGPDAPSRGTILAKMMGRDLNGAPLARPDGDIKDNSFGYAGDAKGHDCPFQAHIRRANPRLVAGSSPKNRETPVPRIVRRGMSYGARYDPAQADPPTPGGVPVRGIVFMAYNARIAEQFEQIQRWVSGGNSSGGLSAQGDPFLAPRRPGRSNTFRFVEGTKVQRVDLSRPTDADGRQDHRPFVLLQWGLYLFTPSHPALALLRDAAAAAATGGAEPRVWSAEEGERLIQCLLARQAQPGADGVALWKQALEDPTEKREFRSAAIWEAIRVYHGGVLRTPFGVLVADAKRVEEVFANADGRYSVKGYRERTATSFGEIYLGLDRPCAGGEYDRQAQASNAGILSIQMEKAFEQAFGSAQTFIRQKVKEVKSTVEAMGLKSGYELTLDLKEVSDHVLADLCELWFGLQHDRELRRGSLDWSWKPADKPLYPGHFTAPSRYVFQPRPGPVPAQMGHLHGQALRSAARALGERLASEEAPLQACPAGQGILQAALDRQADPVDAQDWSDWFARTYVGALVGFLPSVDGNYRATLNEWLRDEDFWRLRERLLAEIQNGPPSFDAAVRLVLPAMVRTMLLRPIPETVWRTAVSPHRLGDEVINADDHIVVSIVAAMQQSLTDPVDQAPAEDAAGEMARQLRLLAPVFGGLRRHALPQRPDEPVHACPGYKAGVGALLGLYAALLGLKSDLPGEPWLVRAGPAPLSLVIAGRAPPPPPAAVA